MGPLIYFASASYYGGSFKSTVQLIRGLKKITDVKLIDVYGACHEYIQDLRDIGIEPIILFPERSGPIIIGGAGVQRFTRMALAIPHLLETVRRLRQVLLELQPRALWVDQEKALFQAWLAAPQDLPIVVYIRASLQGIKPYCASAWHRADAAFGLSESCLHYLRSTRYAHSNLRVIYSGVDTEGTLERASQEPKG